MKKIFNIFLTFVLFLVFATMINAEVITVPNDYLSSNLSITKLSIDLNHYDADAFEINEEFKDVAFTYENANSIRVVFKNNNRKAIEYVASEESLKPYLVKMKFRNVGSIGGKSIDAYLYVDKVKFGNLWGGGVYATSGTGIIGIEPSKVSLGSQAVGERFLYAADQFITLTIEIVWSDTQTLVDYPFLMGLEDLDIYRTNQGDFTKESWTPVDGFAGNIYKYSSSTLTDDGQNIWHNSKKNNNTQGNASYLNTGLYADTENGRFTSTYQEGLCATTVIVYNQASNEGTTFEPVKDSTIVNVNGESKNLVDSTDDEIIYNINQEIGYMYKNIFTPYNRLSIRDRISDDLEYESAMVLLDDGENVVDITNNASYGELSYNNGTKTVEYKFNSAWLAEKNNYKGQIIRITIKTKVQNARSSYKNTAYTNINEVDFSSNEVEDNFIKYPITYKYVSGTEGMDLPNAINVNSGSYKITDNRTYLIGENTTRAGNVEPGTKYNVYNTNNELVGVWELDNWDKDSAIMTNSGIEFVGTWIYKEYREVTYEYISGTEGRELPEDIKTTEGTYKISDDNKYLIGDSVVRKNDVVPGVIYNVYNEQNELVGVWQLDNWDKDSALMTNSGIEFVGTWIYKEYREVTYEYISGTEGRELPEDIKTTEGTYKISDDNKYLIGDSVVRKNDVVKGTIYEVYEDGKIVGTWVLKNWNADELEMTEQGAKFVGVWEYIENPKTFDSIHSYLLTFIISILNLCFIIKLFNKTNSLKSEEI